MATEAAPAGTATPPPSSLGSSSRDEMPITQFADVIAPVPVEEFLSSYGGHFRHIPGPDDKFEGLLPWDQLNLILRQHRLDHPRLRIAREGVVYSREAVLDYVQSRHGNEIPRLRVGDLINEVRTGATLVVDAVDEASESVGALAESFERTLRERVQVNAYFGCGAIHGFDLHWDDHDVFVLQLLGRKRWLVRDVLSASWSRDVSYARRRTAGNRVRYQERAPAHRHCE